MQREHVDNWLYLDIKIRETFWSEKKWGEFVEMRHENVAGARKFAKI